MYKIDAEKAIIHILIHSPELILEITNQLTPEYFCFDPAMPRTGSLFQGIIKAIENGARELTPAILSTYTDLSIEYIQQFDQLEGIKVSNLDAYIAQVSDAYANRLVRGELTSILQQQYTGAELQVKIEELQRKVLLAGNNKVEAGRGDVVIARFREKMYRDRLIPLEQRVVKTPLTDFDKLIGGLYRPQLHVVAARPGMGKTALAQLFTDYTINSGKKAAYFILETSQDALTQRYVTQRTGIPIRDLIEQTFVDDPQKNANVEKALDDLANPNRYTYGSEYRNFEKLVSLLYQLKSMEGDDLYLVVIDFFQLLNTSKSFHSDATQLSYMVQALDALCSQLNLHILILSQINRENESAADKRPRLHNLKSTGGLEESGHLVGILYRNDYYDLEGETEELRNVAELNYQKHRAGETGIVRLYWDGATMTYKNLAQTDHLLDTNYGHMF